MAAPVAATTLYFVHPDHLGTPRVVADAAGVTVWRWDNLEPFGLTGVQQDPDGNGQAFVFNLRFAGQYFDAESGLFHNRHRDYDSASGRYVQADPIGLAGGISLYSYVGANPLGFVDRSNTITKAMTMSQRMLPLLAVVAPHVSVPTASHWPVILN